MKNMDPENIKLHLFNQGNRPKLFPSIVYVSHTLKRNNMELRKPRIPKPELYMVIVYNRCNHVCMGTANKAYIIVSYSIRFFLVQHYII